VSRITFIFLPKLFFRFSIAKRDSFFLLIPAPLPLLQLAFILSSFQLLDYLAHTFLPFVLFVLFSPLPRSFLRTCFF